jgi:hypothetical protein
LLLLGERYHAMFLALRDQAQTVDNGQLVCSMHGELRGRFARRRGGQSIENIGEIAVRMGHERPG